MKSQNLPEPYAPGKTLEEHLKDIDKGYNSKVKKAIYAYTCKEKVPFDIFRRSGFGVLY